MYGNSSSGILQLIPTQPYIPTFVIQWNLSWTVTHWPLDRLVWSVDSQLKRQSRVLVPYYPKEPKLDSWFIQNSFQIQDESVSGRSTMHKTETDKILQVALHVLRRRPSLSIGHVAKSQKRTVTVTAQKCKFILFKSWVVDKRLYSYSRTDKYSSTHWKKT